MTPQQIVAKAREWKEAGRDLNSCFPDLVLLTGGQVSQEILTLVNNEFQTATVVAVQEPPTWETPAHEDIDLTTADPDALGLDMFDENDAKLIDRIELAKHAAQTKPDPLKQYQEFILSIFQPTDTVCFMMMKHGGRPVHEFLLAENAIKPEHFAKLKTLNEQYSIYIGMNSYKPELIGRDSGRTKENVAAVRTLYADADESGPERLQKIRSSDAVPASIILESSENKFQFIWPVQGIEKTDAELLLRAIAQTFKTDPTVAEIARVLRVPGFVNRKYLGTPQVVKLVQASTTVSTRADFKLNLEEVQVKVLKKEAAVSAESAKYRELGEAVGWTPLVRRMNTLPDSRSHVTDLKPGEVVSCPFHEHRDYSNNFGVMASNPALVHCLGRCTETGRSTWDVVAAVQQFDKLPGPLEAVRKICKEEGLKFEEFFPPNVKVGTSSTNVPQTAPASSPVASTGTSRLQMQRADTLRPVMIRWLWEDRIPLGKISLFGGNPDQGKSLVSLYMAARVTKGEPLYGSAKAIPASDVLILAAEDDPSDTIVPRLMAAQADLTRVYFVKSILVEQGKDKTPEEREAQLDTDVQEVEKLLKENPEIRLIIIDPISSYLGDANMNREQEVRRVLTPLKKLADKSGVAIVMIMHFNKNSEANAIHRIGGAVAFTGVSRTSWVFLPEEGTDNRLMLRLKNNLAHTKGGLVYKIDSRTVEVSDGITSQPFVEFTGKNASTAQDVLKVPGAEPTRSPEQGRPSEKRESAEDWLRNFLSEGDQTANDIKAFSKKAGHKWHTVMRAKETLGVISQKVWEEELGKFTWVWLLPKSESNSVTLAA